MKKYILNRRQLKNFLIEIGSPVTIEMSNLIEKGATLKKAIESTKDVDKMPKWAHKRANGEFNHFVNAHYGGDGGSDKHTAFWITGSGNLLMIKQKNIIYGKTYFEIFTESENLKKMILRVLKKITLKGELKKIKNYLEINFPNNRIVVELQNHKFLKKDEEYTEAEKIAIPPNKKFDFENLETFSFADAIETFSNNLEEIRPNHYSFIKIGENLVLSIWVDPKYNKKNYICVEEWDVDHPYLWDDILTFKKM